jgi:hypothetical protein
MIADDRGHHRKHAIAMRSNHKVLLAIIAQCAHMFNAK